MPGGKKTPNNEEIFLMAATTSLAFRNALKDKDRDKLSKELDLLGVKIKNKDEVLEAILKVDWSQLKALEERLHTGPGPMMN